MEDDDMTTPIMSIGQIVINTHDVHRAVAFYRDALGLDYLFETGPPLGSGRATIHRAAAIAAGSYARRR
jgi:catechol 2,3-dioxygenase-like lactoylglutathione lyase family enzyme